MNKETFTDEAGVLSLLVGVAAHALAGDATKQSEIFGPRDRNDKEVANDSESAREALDKMRDAAEKGNNKEYLKHFVTLPKYLRKGMHGIAKSIKSGAATVADYGRALERSRKGAAFSLKRSAIKTVHEGLAKNKLTYTGNTLRIKTKRGKQILMKRGKPFAIAKRRVGGGYLLQTYFPTQLNIVGSEVASRLEQNSKPRIYKLKKPNRA